MNSAGHPRKRGAQRNRPTRPPTCAARWLAFRALQAFSQRGAYVSQVLDSLFRERDVEPRERRFATELANESVRRQGTLDTILAAYVDRPREDVDPEIWLLLRLGCYQLAFAEGIPPHAAVNETVNLCGQLKQQAARKFVNAILRSIAREVDRQGLPPDKPAESEISSRPEFSCEPVTPSIGSASIAPTALSECSPTRVPVLRRRGFEFVSDFVEFGRPVFSIPTMSPQGYLSQALSLPRWLVERWLSEGTSIEQLMAIGLWLTTSGRTSLRINLQQTTREKLLDVLATANIAARPGGLPESITLAGSINPVDVPGYREGWFSIQDESAMRVVDLLAPQSGESILDLCAAPGGKSTHLAERLGDSGSVLACDVSKSRLETVVRNRDRLQLTNIRTQLIASDGSDLPRNEFDAALVDVPCSNTGVLGKRPEARWRLTPDSIDELVPLQWRLLSDALSAVSPSGRVAYSTCSIDHAENEDVVRRVLFDHPEWHLAAEFRHVPGAPGDGGYQALLIRP